jgi:hypothetical protein
MSRRTSPGWGDSIPERIKYLVWHLVTHPEFLEALFFLLDDHQRRKPGVRMSVRDAFAVMRWNGSGVDNDVFRVNSNLIACFTRIYVMERPDAQKLLDLRKSWLDSLNAVERAQLDDALSRGRAKLEARDP